MRFFFKKNKNATCAKQKSNKNYTTKKEQNKVMIKKNRPKINVEQTKGNGEFYLYLYLLNTQLKEISS